MQRRPAMGAAVRLVGAPSQIDVEVPTQAARRATSPRRLRELRDVLRCAELAPISPAVRLANLSARANKGRDRDRFRVSGHREIEKRWRARSSRDRAVAGSCGRLTGDPDVQSPRTICEARSICPLAGRSALTRVNPTRSRSRWCVHNRLEAGTHIRRSLEEFESFSTRANWNPSHDARLTLGALIRKGSAVARAARTDVVSVCRPRRSSLARCR